MLRILLIGSAGQVGFELAAPLRAIGDVTALDRNALDLSDRDAVRTAVSSVEPSLIVNAAAYTRVDDAESEPETARAINAVAPGVLAEEARRLGAALVHYSTDYVFDGRATTPYREDDPAEPESIYGRTKLEGERAVIASGASAIVLRTSWVYGLRGRNFLLTIRRLAGERDELRVVDDQIGAPTWCGAIARATTQAIGSLGSDPARALAGREGIYHLTCAGSTSWWGFARALLDRDEDPARRSVSVVPIPTSEYPTPAPRPAWSVLDNARFAATFGIRLADWEIALDAALGRRDPDSVVERAM